MHTKRDGNTPKYVFIEVQCFFLEHKMHIYDQVNVTYNLNIVCVHIKKGYAQHGVIYNIQERNVLPKNNKQVCNFKHGTIGTLAKHKK